MPRIKIIRFHFILMLSIAVGCVVPAPSFALSLDASDGIRAPVSLAGHLSVFHDPDGALTITDITAAEASFQPIPTMVAQGYRKGAVWVKFSLAAASENAWLLQIERPLIEQVSLYVPDGEGGFVESPPGIVSADAAGSWAYARYFRLAVPAVESTYYLRLQSSTSITTALNLWQPEGYEAYRNSDHWIMGIVLGAIGTMTLANLLSAFLLRDALYLRYAAVLVASALVAMFHMGYADEILHTLAPAQIHRGWGVIVCLYSVVMVSFLGRLFEFDRHWKWAGRAIQLSVALNGAAAFLALAGRYGEVGLFVSNLQQVSYLAIAVFVLYLLVVRRLRQYVLSAVAFAVIIALSLIMQDQYTGSNLLGIDGSLSRQMAIGTLIHLILLSVAVAERARRAEVELGREKDRIIAVARSAEQELATRVSERTAELAEINVSLNREMDRRKLLETKLRQSLDSVNEALAQQRDFVALVSHEFRAPLAVIAAASDNLLSFDDEDEVRTRAGRIQRTVKRMSLLIDNVLVGARLDAGHASFTETLDLNDVLSAVENGLEDDIARRVRLVRGEPSMVKSERGLLEIVLLNLVQNALKHSPAHSLVTVELSGGAEEAIVEVTDQGGGVAPEDHERIFEKYYRAAGQQASGSGLGLYISRSISRQHGGELILAETGSNGSTFRLTLPVTG